MEQLHAHKRLEHFFWFTPLADGQKLFNQRQLLLDAAHSLLSTTTPCT